MLGKQLPVRYSINRLPRLCLLAFLLLVPIGNAGSQDLLEDSGGASKKYLIKLSGNVLRERFTEARGVLSIAHPPPGSLNPYLIIVEGFPQKNSRNSFYWSSEFTFMTVVGAEVRCSLKRSYTKQPDIHFFHLSPILLESRVFLTQHEQERLRLAEKTALPTKVMAQMGELRATFTGNQVSGKVSLKGYDTIEQAYVAYHAQWYGRESTRIEPSQRKMK